VTPLVSQYYSDEMLKKATITGPTLMKSVGLVSIVFCLSLLINKVVVVVVVVAAAAAVVVIMI